MHVAHPKDVMEFCNLFTHEEDCRRCDGPKVLMIKFATMSWCREHMVPLHPTAHEALRTFDGEDAKVFGRVGGYAG
jgi:hypothetical protein